MTTFTLPACCDASLIDMNADQYLSKEKYVTIALIDSRSLTREGLARLLNDSGSLKLITASRCSELLRGDPQLLSEIEIVLLNIGSFAISNPKIIGAIESLKEALLKASIMVICDREDGDHIAEALHKGIRGYFPTSLTSQILMGALDLLQAGGTFIPACALMEALAQKPIVLEAAKAEVEAPNSCGLTPRQQEVFDLLRQGNSNKLIAYKLNMCESTVKVHVRNIMRKMCVTNRTEAAFLAWVHARHEKPEPDRNHHQNHEQQSAGRHP